MPLWLVGLVMIAALLVAVLGARFARGMFGRDDDESSTAADFGAISGPLIAITTLTLSFALVNVWGSFHEASVAASNEALAVDYQGDMAQQLTDATSRREVEATLVCYARAIAGPEWQAMKQRGEATADEVDPWTDRLEAQISQIANAPGGPGAAARQMLQADKERGDARSRRLTTARPSIPLPVLMLLLFVAAAAVISLGWAHLPEHRGGLHVAALVVVTTALFALFCLITELDSPFHGLVDIGPTDMTRVAVAEANDFAESFPGAALPCDESGRVR